MYSPSENYLQHPPINRNDFEKEYLVSYVFWGS